METTAGNVEATVEKRLEQLKKKQKKLELEQKELEFKLKKFRIRQKNIENIEKIKKIENWIVNDDLENIKNSIDEIWDIEHAIENVTIMAIELRKLNILPFLVDYLENKNDVERGHFILSYMIEEYLCSVGYCDCTELCSRRKISSFKCEDLKNDLVLKALYENSFIEGATMVRLQRYGIVSGYCEKCNRKIDDGVCGCPPLHSCYIRLK